MLVYHVEVSQQIDAIKVVKCGLKEIAKILHNLGVNAVNSSNNFEEFRDEIL